MSDFGCAIQITSKGGAPLNDHARKRVGEFLDLLREGENFYDASGEPFKYETQPALDDDGQDVGLFVILSRYYRPEALDDEMLALTLSEDRACAEAIIGMLQERFGGMLRYEIFAGAWDNEGGANPA